MSRVTARPMPWPGTDSSARIPSLQHALGIGVGNAGAVVLDGQSEPAFAHARR